VVLPSVDVIQDPGVSLLLVCSKMLHQLHTQSKLSNIHVCTLSNQAEQGEG